MARITVEDCIAVVPDRFELILLAAERARQIGQGHGVPTPIVTKGGKTLAALREIADGHADAVALKEDTIRRQMKVQIEDDRAEEALPLSADAEARLQRIHEADARRLRMMRQAEDRIYRRDASVPAF